MEFVIVFYTMFLYVGGFVEKWYLGNAKHRRESFCFELFQRKASFFVFLRENIF